MKAKWVQLPPLHMQIAHKRRWYFDRQFGGERHEVLVSITEIEGENCRRIANCEPGDALGAFVTRPGQCRILIRDFHGNAQLIFLRSSQEQYD